jgi:hypothetical protein
LAAILVRSGQIDGLLAVEAPLWTNKVPTLRWLITPVFFFFTLLGTKKGQAWFIRDFNSLQILLAWPMIWPFRKRLYWVNSHNLHVLRQNPLGRRLFSYALRTGFQLVQVESTAGFDDLFGSHARARPICLPYPMGQNPTTKAPHEGLVVGFVGRFRGDKAQEEALGRLLAERSVAFSIAVANPDPEVLRRYASLGCITYDTSSREQFEAALRQIDIAVLNYRREHYQYRPSGVVRDLAEAGIAVVCPDMPVIKDQISIPTAVGATYKDLNGLEHAIASATRLVEHKESFEQYRRYRSADNIRKLFHQQTARAAR